MKKINMYEYSDFIDVDHSFIDFVSVVIEGHNVTRIPYEMIQESVNFKQYLSIFIDAEQASTEDFQGEPFVIFLTVEDQERILKDRDDNWDPDYNPEYDDFDPSEEPSWEEIDE